MELVDRLHLWPYSPTIQACNHHHAGVEVNLPIFIGASIFARALRFFAVAWIISKWGATAKQFIDKYFNLLATLFVILLIGGFAILKLLF